MILLGGLFGVLACLSLPKIWTVTPLGFSPRIRISVLDLLQAQALARSARQANQAGRFDEALAAWQMAVAHHPGSLTYRRELLETLIQQPNLPSSHIDRGIFTAVSLLKLSHTNLNDLTLFARFCETNSLNELALYTFYDRRKELNLSVRGSLLKACYRSGDSVRFQKIWDESPTELQSDPTLVLFHVAWANLWGPIADLESNTRLLNQAIDNPSTALLAHELSLTISAHRRDLHAFEVAFRFLSVHDRDRPDHHATYWKLLFHAGRPSEAIEFAKKYKKPPQSAAALLQITDALKFIGLQSEAIQLVEVNLPAFSDQTPVWVELAELLGVTGRWSEVRQLGIQLRSNRVQRVAASGYGWFLEGFGRIKSFPPKNGDAEFEQMLRHPISSPLLGYRCAILLQKEGKHELARHLLESLENHLGSQSDYWFRVSLNAYQTGDIDLMLSASERAYRLEPSNQAILNNLSAALLMLRQNPPKAVELTLRRVIMTPDDPAARINHLLALVLNRRFPSARDQLLQLDPDRMTASEATFIHFARFEIAIHEDNQPVAQLEFARVEPRFLKSAQLDWFNQNDPFSNLNRPR